MDSHNQILTCLLGDPVDHSVSDVMFQYFAQIAGIDNYNHLKFRISNTDTKNLETAMQALRVLGFAGANITLPYKESVIEYLDSIDDVAKRMGAVNTVVHRDGFLIGYNTDGKGAINAIESQSRPIRKSDKVLILGAGGAARAIIASLAGRVDNIIVLNRDSDIARAIKLKNDFANLTSAIEVKPLSDENIISSLANADIVINATPVGMYPDRNCSLVNKKHIDSLPFSREFGDMIFFDAVFNPYLTDFLKLAQECGAQTCPGIYMMIYQGIEAFCLWTGKQISENEVERTCELLRGRIESTYER